MITIGLFAPVDSGKTTLSEAILYRAGVIRKLGRVDHGTAFLDAKPVERARGITVYSKEARFSIGEKNYVLLDTPGHEDFGPEAERAMRVLDLGVLIISAPDMIKPGTEVLWKLLGDYGLPVMIFVNKIDRLADFGSERARISMELLDKLSQGCIMPGVTDSEDIAALDEGLLEEYLEKGKLSREGLRAAFLRRSIFPVYFGSALKNSGMEEFMAGVDFWTEEPEAADMAGVVAYKTDRDDRGVRQVHMRLMGGSLHPKDVLVMETPEGPQTMQIQQLRAYNGENYSLLKEAGPGEIVAATGLDEIAPVEQLLRPEKTCRIILPEGVDPVQGLARLKSLGEEEPSLGLRMDGLRNEIHADYTGSLELEILSRAAEERTGLKIEFGPVSEIPGEQEPEPEEAQERELTPVEEFSMSGDEEKDLERIFKRTFGESKRDRRIPPGINPARGKDGRENIRDNFPRPNPISRRGAGATYYVVDGYNAMFAWDELRDCARENLDSAREIFIEALMNFQGIRRVGMTVVFDGYKVKGGAGAEEKRGDLNLIYTREGETADRFIEEMIYNGAKKFDYTVVTSDLPVQMAAMGDGARRMSSREFYLEVNSASAEIRERLKKQVREKNRPFEGKL